MIVLEQEHSFFMVTQHDHAKVSGDIAQYWKDEYFVGLDRKSEVVLAIYEHDRGWIEPDTVPLWNEKSQKPYSFIDYPVEPKIHAYQKGLDEVALMNDYSALLCSLHYSSFLQHANDSKSTSFYTKEQERQHQLFKSLEILGLKDREMQLEEHLNILKLCDNLSLYICLNKPGIDKSNEHPFYRNGFQQSFSFSNNRPIQVHWENHETVSLSVLPLEKELEVLLTYKNVNKKDIRKNGLIKAYENNPSSIRRVTFK